MDVQTDMKKLVVAFRNFANAPIKCTYKCLMLDNLFRILTDHKQCIGKKQNVEIDSAATTGGQWKRTYVMYFPWPPMKATLPVFNVRLFAKIIL